MLELITTDGRTPVWSKLVPETSWYAGNDERKFAWAQWNGRSLTFTIKSVQGTLFEYELTRSRNGHYMTGRNVFAVLLNTGELRVRICSHTNYDYLLKVDLSRIPGVIA